MISLGTIPVTSAASVLEARKKLHLLADALGLDPLTATRVASAVSAMTRQMARQNTQGQLDVSLEIDGGHSALMITFIAEQAVPRPPFLASIFDDVQMERTETHYRVRTGMTLPRRAEPGHDTLDELRRLVRQKSRDELMGELTIKNRELQESLDNLRRTRSAKERMESELNIGRDIQMRMLPMEFPAFPHRHEFDIFATMHPAREVGGDFYDFFLIDEDRLCFGIGDVSGKGVSSALFMAMTKTLIKSRASNDLSPASILTHVNDEMAENNDAAMFVTIWLGILDIRDGRVAYTNAGHNPPYLRRADGTLERLATRHGPVVGAMEGMVYGESTLTLAPDDAILLYTDGVTEAMDPSQTLYEEQRMVASLEQTDTARPDTMVRATVDNVWAFQADAEQADDITLLALHYKGTTEGDRRTLTVTVEADLAQIAHVNETFNAFAEKHELPAKTRRSMNLVFDELLNNTISYGFDDPTSGEITIDVELTGDRLAVTIVDNGKPFNPLSAATPDTGLGVEERGIGGLGIHLVRNVMDEVTYHRRIDRNVMRLAKHLT